MRSEQPWRWLFTTHHFHIFVKYNSTSQNINTHFSRGHTETIACSVSVIQTGRFFYHWCKQSYYSSPKQLPWQEKVRRKAFTLLSISTMFLKWSYSQGNGGQTQTFFRVQCSNVLVTTSPALSVMFQLSNQQTATDPKPDRSPLLDGERFRDGHG